MTGVGKSAWPPDLTLLASRDPDGVLMTPWPPDGHMHLASQPCHTSCEPNPRLRCACLGTWNDPDFEDQCHRRATQEDGRCDDCRDRCFGARNADLKTTMLYIGGERGMNGIASMQVASFYTSMTG